MATGVNPMRMWTVRGMPREVAEEIRLMGRARNWSVAETVQALVAFTKAAQEWEDGQHNVGDLAWLLEEHGLLLVKR